jgi:two-component system OmpR family sensor kinase
VAGDRSRIRLVGVVVTDHLPGSAPVGDLVPVEVVPVGDAIDPNSALPEYWTPPDTTPTDLGAVPPLGPADSADQGDQPGRRGWRFAPRTLQWRLVSGVVALVLVVVAAAGIATYAALGGFLTDRLDQQLGGIADANKAVTSVRCDTTGDCVIGFGRGGVTSPGASPLRGASRLWFTMIDSSGAPLKSINSNSPDLLIMDLSKAQSAAIAANPGTNRNVTTTDGQSLRITARTIPTQVGMFVQITGLSTDDQTNTLNQLLELELEIGAGAVLVAFLATAFGVRLSLRPLHRVTNTARAVAAELSPEGAGLERRVEVTEPTTEVGQLAESVNTLLGAVGTQFAARVESEQRMRQFMADASHELRTPLTSIRGYAELARMQRAFNGDADSAQSSASDAEALERIESEGTRMSRLVEDLLTLARGDIGAPIESLPVDVAEVIDEAVEGVQAAHPNRRFGVTSYPGIVVNGDHDQLLRVIRNLLTNAAVHTAPGRPIRVSASREAGQVVVQVIDSGPGLPPEQAAHVFERFWRSDSSRARTSGGSGLGLAIVASIVAAHGGTVRFNSSVEAGSVVTVTLPAR